jgi:DNA-binding NarL/FixJ family response regulator
LICKRILQKARIWPTGEYFLRVVIADDHEVVRRGVKALFESVAQWIVCGEAEDGQEAVALVAKLRPDLVVLDVSMPVLNGLQAATQIRQVSPGTKIVVLSMHESPYIAKEALQAGADAFLPKSSAGTRLIQTVRGLFSAEPGYLEQARDPR